MPRLPFVKMHGIGNDYVYLDAVTDPSIEALDLPGLSRRVSDRHTGIGSDGLILLCRPTEPRPSGSGGGQRSPTSTTALGHSAPHLKGPHVRMRMFNKDGSEGEMCGNGIRCVAKFAHDRLGIHARPMLVETRRGVLSIDYAVQEGKLVSATVDMGPPDFDLDTLGVDESRLGEQTREHTWMLPLDTGERFEAVLVSTGNPHAVIFTDDVAAVDLPRLGPLLERHPAFAHRANIHFAQVHSRGEATMRTWERGSGITMACGTGACAVLVAGVVTGRLGREALLRLPGGELRIRWDDATGCVFKRGPAVEVFEGVIEL